MLGQVFPGYYGQTKNMLYYLLTWFSSTNYFKRAFLAETANLTTIEQRKHLQTKTLFICLQLTSLNFINKVEITLLRSKSMLVRIARWCNGCGGRKLFPRGALGCRASPCISRRSPCNCHRKPTLRAAFLNGV